MNRAASIFLGLVIAFAGCNQDGVPEQSEDPVFRAQRPTSQQKKEFIDKVRSARESAKAELNSVTVPNFVDLAKTSGLDFVAYRDAIPDRYYFPEIMGSGIGCLDYDLDGFCDLYFGNGDRLVPTEKTAESSSDPLVNQVFRNREGAFENVTRSATLDGTGFAQCVTVGDLNRDGFADVFVSNFGTDFFLINQGDGSFQRQDLASSDSPLWSTGSLLVDLDSDGDLDLFVTHYVDWTVSNHHPCKYDEVVGYCGPGTYSATRDELFENMGDGRFQLVANSGVDFPTKGLVAAAADFNHDGIPEIYVGSDLTENAFYVVEAGGLKLKNQAVESGTGVSKNGLAEATMGIAIRDFDDNGDPDLFLTHYYRNKNTLYLNQGKLLFRDASYESRIKALSTDFIGFGTLPVDYDHDGDFDLFVTNGHVLGKHIPPFLFQPQILNNSGGRFSDESPRETGYFSRSFAGRSAASSDFDNDGDQDLVVGHLDEPVALLSNESQRQPVMHLQLISLERDDLVGTEVIVKMGEKVVTIPMTAGESYLSSSDPRLIIGTAGQATAHVTVRWRNGTEQDFGMLSTDRRWVLGSDGVANSIPFAMHSLKKIQDASPREKAAGKNLP